MYVVHAAIRRFPACSCMQLPVPHMLHCDHTYMYTDMQCVCDWTFVQEAALKPTAYMYCELCEG